MVYTATEIVVRPPSASPSASPSPLPMAASAPKAPSAPSKAQPKYPAITTTKTTMASEYTLQPPSPLIRKKSGDIVKSSLKLSSLARSASTPHLPQRKSVKFADRLTNVRMFDGSQSPQTVSTPLHSPQSEFDVEYIAGAHTADYFGSPSSAPRSASFEFQSDSDSDEDTAAKYDIDFTTMTRPHQYFYQQLGNPSGAGATTATTGASRAAAPVYMHSAQLSADNHFVGLVDVANIAFEKFIEVKMTSDNWRTTLSIQSTSPLVSYVKPLGDGSRDQFKFTIPIDGLVKGQQSVTLELCCKYAAAGKVFWDNNHGQNYTVVLKRQPSSRKSSSSSSPQRKKIVPVVDDEPVVPMAPRRKSEFSKYNFDVQRPPLKSSHSSPDFFAGTTPTTPGATNKPRYSRQYRDKQSAEVPRSDAFAKLSYTDLLAQFCFSGGASAPAPASAPKSAANAPTTTSTPTTAGSPTTSASAAGAIKAPTPIKAVSPPHPHTTTTTTTIDHPPSPRKLAPCRPSTAATLHALGDEIHI
ncbi:hypothetical protein DIURU_005151 [Diutina rugosa]|uniref:CBM21 domain-containing protein n=1 Tax=Diutina rugosa TaxID=5481 RepID=A0A642UEF2_DIURU|nr:uncharacterized protein DIURU_005151 [Diutina rugosa]KAA8897552.1 hypothetical protein DIURU_005151 [Diutina rugosa]